MVLIVSVYVDFANVFIILLKNNKQSVHNLKSSFEEYAKNMKIWMFLKLKENYCKYYISPDVGIFRYNRYICAVVKLALDYFYNNQTVDRLRYISKIGFYSSRSFLISIPIECSISVTYIFINNGKNVKIH